MNSQRSQSHFLNIAPFLTNTPTVVLHALPPTPCILRSEHSIEQAFLPLPLLIDERDPSLSSTFLSHSSLSPPSIIPSVAIFTILPVVPMWLLSTATAELTWFAHSTVLPTGGYAIISHTWETAAPSEQSFQDLNEIIADCKAKGTIPLNDPRVSEKIRKSCELARSHGYDWVWLDACCINKTSGAGLSEAINSMFLWYAQAEVCYVYLSDVPSGEDLAPKGSKFRRSRWHTRGWTLQELIAPVSVMFYSSDWRFLGTKSDLATLLEEITDVWSEVLEQTTAVWSIGIAERMHWASKRRTTRVEDEAYCLMGLFGVNMPILYGEGRRAFQRLQVEVMKGNIDTSLFTWGPYLPRRIHKTLQPYTSEDGGHGTFIDIFYLLARSPADFSYHGTYYMPQCSEPLLPYTAHQEEKFVHKLSLPESVAYRLRRLFLPVYKGRAATAPFTGGELPRFSITNYGMECRFPIIESQGYTIAVLLCQRGSEHLGLLLHQAETYIQDPARPRYYTSAVVGRTSSTEHPSRARVISLGSDLFHLTLWGRRVYASWKTIYINHSPDFEDSPDIPFFRLRLGLKGVGCQIPCWLISTMTSLGFVVTHREVQSASTYRVQFNNWDSGEHIYLDLGTCSERNAECPAAWIKIASAWRSNPHIPLPMHDCKTDHIAAWAQTTEKRFGDSERGIRASLLPSRSGVGLNPKPVLHLELTGSVYKKLIDGLRVSIPTREELEAREFTQPRPFPITLKPGPGDPQSMSPLLPSSGGISDQEEYVTANSSSTAFLSSASSSEDIPAESDLSNVKYNGLIGRIFLLLSALCAKYLFPVLLYLGLSRTTMLQITVFIMGLPIRLLDPSAWEKITNQSTVRHRRSGEAT